MAHLLCFQLLVQRVLDFQIIGVSIWLCLVLQQEMCPELHCYMATGYFDQFSEQIQVFFWVLEVEMCLTDCL